ACLNVYVNASPVSRGGDLKTFVELTTVCGTSSRFVHVTVVPTATSSENTPSLKLSLSSATAGGGLLPSRALALVSAIAVNVTTAATIANVRSGVRNLIMACVPVL